MSGGKFSQRSLLGDHSIKDSDNEFVEDRVMSFRENFALGLLLIEFCAIGIFMLPNVGELILSYIWGPECAWMVHGIRLVLFIAFVLTFLFIWKSVKR